MTAVADAGPLIHLSWLGRLDLLPALFEEVLVPPAVEDEVLRAGPHVPGVAALREAFGSGWLKPQAVSDPGPVATLRARLDAGESEAIVLMREGRAQVLLLDERRARATAQQEGLPVVGTIGILRMARDQDLIPAVGPC